MMVQEVVDKAVEGGYHIYGSDGMDTDYGGANRKFSVWTRKDNESSFMIPTEETFLDPRFWQALGRALDWSEECDLAITCVHGDEECQRCRGYYWMYQWHCFIHAIADGHTPEAFFAHLTSSPTRSSETKNQPQAVKEHRHRSFLFLLAEEARQHAQYICEAAAGAQEVAKEIVQMSRLQRKKRRGA
jgi:hypothetical protein